MRISTIVFVLGATFFISLSASLAQEDGLRSILVNGDNDLRPLIDLNAPDPPTPTGSTELQKQATKPLASPFLSTPEATDSRPEAGRNSEPIPGLELIEVQPITAKPSTQLPKVQTNNAKPAYKGEITNPDPTGTVSLFDLGVALDPAKRGVLVRGVFVGSPAQRAGIRSGDTIRAVAGRQVASAVQVANAVQRQTRNRDFALTITRDNRIQTVQLQIAGAVRAGVPAQSVAFAPARSKIRTAVPARKSSPQRMVPQRIASSKTLPPAAIRQPRVVAQPASARRIVTGQVPQVPRPTVTGQSVPGQPDMRIALQTDGNASPGQGYRQIVVQRGTVQEQVQPAPRRPLVRGGRRWLGNGRLLNSAAGLLPFNR